MKIQTITANVYGKKSIFDVIQYDYNDIPNVKKAFDAWANLKDMSKILYGRSPNIPECVSETCLCLVTNTVRFMKSVRLKNASFDCFDIVNEKTIQGKACSVKDDLTSFGPKSKWDILYFLDFYNDGEVDGTFNVYEIPNHLIYNCQVKDGRTLQEAQELGLRPRIHLKTDIVIPNGIEPIDIHENTDIMEDIILPAGIQPLEKGIRLW